MTRRALIAVALVAVIAATAADATTPGHNGSIAFTRYRLQNSPLWSEIFVVRPDGTGLTKVSHSAKAVEDDQARWSPDGRWLTFARCTRNGPCSVWVVRSDGTGQRRISPACTRACADESNASFTPDGRHLVLQHEFGRIGHDAIGDQIEKSWLARVDLRHRNMTVLRRLEGFRGDLEAPLLSPDGRSLLFTRSNSARVVPAGGQALFVAPVGGGATRQLTPWRLRAAGADWAPDGRRILFRSTLPSGELTPGNSIYTVRPDGSGLHQLTHLGANHYVLTGSYSPDGHSVVFATDDGATPNPGGGTFADIETMPAAGGKATLVTHAANLDGWPTWEAATP